MGGSPNFNKSVLFWRVLPFLDLSVGNFVKFKYSWLKENCSFVKTLQDQVEKSGLSPISKIKSTFVNVNIFEFKLDR